MASSSRRSYFDLLSAAALENIFRSLSLRPRSPSWDAFLPLRSLLILHSEASPRAVRSFAAQRLRVLYTDVIFRDHPDDFDKSSPDKHVDPSQFSRLLREIGPSLLDIRIPYFWDEHAYFHGYFFIPPLIEYCPNLTRISLGFVGEDLGLDDLLRPFAGKLRSLDGNFQTQHQIQAITAHCAGLERLHLKAGVNLEWLHPMLDKVGPTLLDFQIPFPSRQKVSLNENLISRYRTFFLRMQSACPRIQSLTAPRISEVFPSFANLCAHYGEQLRTLEISPPLMGFKLDICLGKIVSNCPNVSIDIGNVEIPEKSAPFYFMRSPSSCDLVNVEEPLQGTEFVADAHAHDSIDAHPFSFTGEGYVVSVQAIQALGNSLSSLRVHADELRSQQWPADTFACTNLKSVEINFARRHTISFLKALLVPARFSLRKIKIGYRPCDAAYFVPIERTGTCERDSAMATLAMLTKDAPALEFLEIATPILPVSSFESLFHANALLATCRITLTDVVVDGMFDTTPAFAFFNSMVMAAVRSSGFRELSIDADHVELSKSSVTVSRPIWGLLSTGVVKPLSVTPVCVNEIFKDSLRLLRHKKISVNVCGLELLGNNSIVGRCDGCELHGVPL